MLEALLDLDSDALALSTVCKKGRDVTWSYSSISRHVRTVAGGLSASWRASTTAHTSGSGTQQNRHVDGRGHVVVCGSMAFQAIMALVCYRQRYVAVFVPASSEDILSSISVIQRASEAFAIVMEDTVWSSLQLRFQTRLDPVKYSAITFNPSHDV